MDDMVKQCGNCKHWPEDGAYIYRDCKIKSVFKTRKYDEVCNDFKRKES